VLKSRQFRYKPVDFRGFFHFKAPRRLPLDLRSTFVHSFDFIAPAPAWALAGPLAGRSRCVPRLLLRATSKNLRSCSTLHVMRPPVATRASRYRFDHPRS
jgi:hypothetical protein